MSGRCPPSPSTPDTSSLLKETRHAPSRRRSCRRCCASPSPGPPSGVLAGTVRTARRHPGPQPRPRACAGPTRPRTRRDRTRGPLPHRRARPRRVRARRPRRPASVSGAAIAKWTSPPARRARPDPRPRARPRAGGGGRHPRRGRASTLGVSVTVLDGERIAEREAPFLLTCCEEVPGVAVARTGGARPARRPLFVRGGESSFARVLVDGVPVNEPGGEYNFGPQLPLELERVEVVRGAASSLYGTDALAGVVHLVTAAALRGRPRVRARRPRAAASAGGAARRDRGPARALRLERGGSSTWHRQRGAQQRASRRTAGAAVPRRRRSAALDLGAR